MPKETAVELPDDLLAEIEASGRTIPELIRAGLAAGEKAIEKEEEEVWLAGLVGSLLAKLDAGYLLVPRKP